MDVFDSRYFVMNKRLLTVVGLWPYEKASSKRIKRLCVALLIFAMGLPHFIGIIVNFDKNKRILLEHIGTVMLISVASLKIVTSVVYESKMKRLYDGIRSNWKAIVDVHEKKILVEYSEMGRTIGVGWMAYLISGTIMFITLPVTPIIMDIVLPLNNASRPKLYIMNGEFLIDRESNYGKIYIYDSLATAATIFMFMTCDTMYAACVEHCLGLFAIVGFTVTLESTYEQPFFAIIGVNLIYTSLLCVLTLLQTDNLLNLVRYTMLCSGVAIHLFYLSWPGQKLIDRSSELHRQAYLNQWYENSTRSKVLLNFFMLRCSKPSLLTAGGLYIMNFDNFLSVMKKSISFMALFSSFR